MTAGNLVDQINRQGSVALNAALRYTENSLPTINRLIEQGWIEATGAGKFVTYTLSEKARAIVQGPSKLAGLLARLK
jgi:DNA-binding transcriptional regulator PaaX